VREIRKMVGGAVLEPISEDESGRFESKEAMELGFGSADAKPEIH
jgi:hypothetical protein